MNDPDDLEMLVANTNEDGVALLRDVAERYARGEIRGCIAIRLFRRDGSYEDRVIGAADQDEAAAALDQLRQAYAKAN